MSTTWIIIIIALVFGIIIGNIMLLKYSAKLSMKHNKKAQQKEDK